MTPLVTCIVPHHLDENHEYLKLCLDSIIASEGVDFEVICVADTKEFPRDFSHPILRFGILQKYDRLTVYHRPDLNTASAKFNWAAKQARGKYLWLISDDVMVSKHAMRIMVEGMGENQIICNPMSNSDNGSQFYGFLNGLHVKTSRETFIDPHVIVNDQTLCMRGPFLIPVRQFVAFYCTMIPKTIWDKVGELDERMEYRHNDQDYCIRAAQLGIPSMINLGAFALHFGDKTLPKCTTPEMLNECTRVFQEKYEQT